MTNRPSKSQLPERSLHLLVMSLPYIGVLGILLGIPLLTQVGFRLTAAVFAVAAVYGVVLGIYFVYYVVRNFETLTTLQKCLLVPTALFIAFGVSTIIAGLLFYSITKPC